MERKLIGSSSPWESRVGFSRAVRVGPHVYVAGTAPVDKNGDPIAPGDAYRQTLAAFEIIERALEGAGAGLQHVVRTRLYVTDIEFQDDVARAHVELFAEHRPASTLVAVKELVHPDLLVEVEVDAFIHDSDHGGGERDAAENGGE